MFVQRFVIAFVIMSCACGCAPFYRVEVVNLPNGEVSEMRLMRDEVLQSDTPILCRWLQDQDLCASPAYWKTEALQQRNSLILLRGKPEFENSRSKWMLGAD